MDEMVKKRRSLARRRKSIRKKISGSVAKPRLAVFRSNRHIYAQLIDDGRGVTLAAASSLEKGFDGKDKDKSAQAHAVGKLLAERAKAAEVQQVVFDRGGNLYHGRVKALAEGAREGGLEF
ncbi:MAG: 50S ribosomal protein L18 [Candidatus Geothermincolia bacterium]